MAAEGSAARNMLHENALRRKSSAINHLAKRARVPSDVRRAGPSCESRPRRPASAIIIAHLCGGFLVKEVAIDPAKGNVFEHCPARRKRNPTDVATGHADDWGRLPDGDVHDGATFRARSCCLPTARSPRELLFRTDDRAVTHGHETRWDSSARVAGGFGLICPCEHRR
jgi:hypothetical protein